MAITMVSIINIDLAFTSPEKKSPSRLAMATAPENSGSQLQSGLGHQIRSKGDIKMNDDTIKGKLQQIGGHIEEAAGALVGDQALKNAGEEDQLEGKAREAWGNVKDAGNALIDRARAAKADAEIKSEAAEAWDRDHAVEVKTE